jgi:hypothetical protein
MAQKTLKDYWNPSFDALYDAYFYELASEYIIDVWYWIDLTISLLTALTVVASAATGWALWGMPNAKFIWVYLAVTSSVLAIVHCILGVPSRIKKEGERRQRFLTLRLELQSFRDNLPRGSDVSKAQKRFDRLSERLRTFTSKTPPDIVLTQAARKTVQLLVNDRLRNFING